MGWDVAEYARTAHNQLAVRFMLLVNEVADRKAELADAKRRLSMLDKDSSQSGLSIDIEVGKIADNLNELTNRFNIFQAKFNSLGLFPITITFSYKAAREIIARIYLLETYI